MSDPYKKLLDLIEEHVKDEPIATEMAECLASIMEGASATQMNAVSFESCYLASLSGLCARDKQDPMQAPDLALQIAARAGNLLGELREARDNPDEYAKKNKKKGGH